MFAISQKAYEAASKEGEAVNSDGAQQASSDDAKKDDDVIDAEYTKE